MNSEKIILDLCGGTGAWSEPYRKAGYDVRVITLPDWNVNDWAYYPDQDALIFDGKGKALDILVSKIHGILAAPPCTEFSVAKGNAKRDFRKGMDVVSSCMEIIWTVRAHGSLSWWALENPVGFLRQFLGIPRFTYQHWQFGNPQIKPTDIWGYFTHPVKKVRKKPRQLSIKFPNGRANGRGWSKPRAPKRYRGLHLTRADIRAITPPGFARAFFKSNP